MLKRIYNYFSLKYSENHTQQKNIEKRMIDELKRFNPDSNEPSERFYHYILTKVDELNNYLSTKYYFFLPTIYSSSHIVIIKSIFFEYFCNSF